MQSVFDEGKIDKIIKYLQKEDIKKLYFSKC